MRIAHLTAGTSSFYCGTCLRDHALVTELARAGHETLMVPLYLPHMTETPPENEGPLFLGGVNAYLQQKVPLFRKTPGWLDRMLDARWLLSGLASWSGMTSAHDLGELTLAALRGADGEQAKEFERAAEWLATEWRPDVVCLSNALLLGFAPVIRSATGAPVVCSLQGEESFLDTLPEPYRTQCWELVAERAREADALVAVSGWYRDRVAARIGLPAESICVVHNGIPVDGFPETRRVPARPTIGYLAAMIPAKGLATLVDAFVALRKRGTVPGAQLVVAGSQPPGSTAFVRALQAKLEHERLLGDSKFLPDLSRADKIQFLSGLSLFSVPATYGEAFGLYVLEALAAGVPVVQPESGAYPELLALTQGGVLCRAHDPEALASGMEALFTDPETAQMMGARGRDAVMARFTAKHMASQFAAVLADVRGRSAPARASS